MRFRNAFIANRSSSLEGASGVVWLGSGAWGGAELPSLDRANANDVIAAIVALVDLVKDPSSHPIRQRPNRLTSRATMNS